MNRDRSTTTVMNVWPLLATLGAINLVVGVVAVFWPGVTLTVVAFLFGIQLLIIGGLRILLSLVLPELESRWLGVIVGLVGIVVGFLVMREPLRTVEILVVLVGVLWVAWGIIGLVSAALSSGSRTGVVLESAASLISGGVLLVWPGITVRAFTLVVGIALVVIGAAELFAAYETRNIRVEVGAT